MSNLYRAADADKPKVITTLATLARADQDPTVAAAAIIQMPSVGGIEQIPVILEVVEQRGNEDVAYAAASALFYFASNHEIKKWDPRPIAAAATAIVNNPKAGGYARADALRSLRAVKDPSFKPMALKLKMAGDELLASQVQLVLDES